jgi:wyosine [tRNA(Phe)-imidazoG37] synthetase (radical SAM superfamily)
MWCDILQSLYVRSNGEVPCHDDVGERIRLGQLEGNLNWNISEILTNDKYHHIFDSLKKEKLPWPGTCDKCAFLRRKAPYNNFIQNKKRIEFLQIEPSLLCELSCPGCTRQLQLQQREKPFLMQIKNYEKLLSNLRDNSYIINNIEYCGQGEPLAHPNIERFITIAKKIYPETNQKIITNGNYDYNAKFEKEHPNEIVVSCDGYYQASYEKYRVNGSIDKVLNFLKDAKKHSPKGHSIIWKYILFSHNDSEKELLAAQKKARELKIDCLLFVLSHYPNEMVSKVYGNNNLYTLPILESNVSFLSTLNILHREEKITIQPHMNVTNIFSKIGLFIFKKVKNILNLEKWKIFQRSFECIVDNFRIMTGTNSIIIDGWAVDENLNTLQEIKVYFGFKFIGTARLNLYRPDVAKAMGYKNQFSGFIFSKKIKGFQKMDKINLKIKLISTSKHKEIYSYRCKKN